MPLTDVEICQKALLLLGAEPIQSLNDQNFRSQLCSSIYPELKKSALSETHWNFATKKRQLSQLASDPNSEWDHQYNLPSDMVTGPHSVFVDSDSTRPIQEWEIVGGKLMTNHEKIWIDYTQEVDETEFPPYFVEFIKYALAAQLAKPITDQTTTAQFFEEKAYGPASDNTNGGLLGKARKIDSQNQSTQSISDFPLTDVRHAGTSGNDGHVF